jgi:hypothetical protein
MKNNKIEWYGWFPHLANAQILRILISNDWLVRGSMI